MIINKNNFFELKDIPDMTEEEIKKASEQFYKKLAKNYDIAIIKSILKENKQLKEEIETILDFDYFKNECPLNIGFGDELENKAQDVFYEDEYCESCKDDYKACWLKYFKKLQELKEKYK